MNFNENIKPALISLLKYIIAAIITFFVYLSVLAVATGVFAKPVGYTAYSADNNEVLYHYYFSDGEDTKLEEYKSKGVEVSTVTLRGELQGAPKTVSMVIIQFIGAAVTVAMVCGKIKKIGFSDSNSVKFEHKQYDILRGLKIGFLADIPLVASYCVLLLANLKIIPQGFVAIFRFANFSVFYLLSSALGTKLTVAGEFTALQLLIAATALLVLPLLCGIGYYVGYNNINFGDYIYKKEKEER